MNECLDCKEIYQKSRKRVEVVSFQLEKSIGGGIEIRMMQNKEKRFDTHSAYSHDVEDFNLKL